MSSEDDFKARKRRTQSVLDLIAERHGSRVAGEWAYGCTPIPCGLPDDGMLADGLRLAKGEVTLDELLAKVDAEIRAAMAENDPCSTRAEGK